MVKLLTVSEYMINSFSDSLFYNSDFLWLYVTTVCVITTAPVHYKTPQVHICHTVASLQRIRNQREAHEHYMQVAGQREAKCKHLIDYNTDVKLQITAQHKIKFTQVEHCLQSVFNMFKTKLILS